jgi:hypothetical protein
MSLGIPLFSKRVLAHVYGAEELCELAEDLVHGKGGNIASYSSSY